MNLRDMIAADAANIFGNEDDNAVSATLTTPGSDPITIVGNLFTDDEAEVQGLNLDDGDGKRIVIIGHFETLASHVFEVSKRGEECSTLTIDNVVWQCIRIEGRDSGMQCVAVRREEKVATRTPRRGSR